MRSNDAVFVWKEEDAAHSGSRRITGANNAWVRRDDFGNAGWSRGHVLRELRKIC